MRLLFRNRSKRYEGHVRTDADLSVYTVKFFRPILEYWA